MKKSTSSSSSSIILPESLAPIKKRKSVSSLRANLTDVIFETIDTDVSCDKKTFSQKYFRPDIPLKRSKVFRHRRKRFITPDVSETVDFKDILR
jgi:hypothetical protein